MLSPMTLVALLVVLPSGMLLVLLLVLLPVLLAVLPSVNLVVAT